MSTPAYTVHMHDNIAYIEGADAAVTATPPTTYGKSTPAPVRP